MSEWKGGITKAHSARGGKKKKAAAKKPKRIAPVSKKRKVQTTKYEVIRSMFLSDNCRCFRCPKDATEVHHANGRRGNRLTDVEFFIPACRKCHRWAHDNPEAAKEQGWFA